MRNRKEYHQNWYKKNRVKIRKLQKEYYEANKDAIKLRQINSFHENRHSDIHCLSHIQ